ncbi:MAG: type II toxin-antitoxin system VapC family toxin [Cyanobacteria bacterium P01_F01_bin.150]
MAILIDTHVMVWYMAKPTKLSALAKETIQTTIANNEPIYLSAISSIEICYLVERNKLPTAFLERFNTAVTTPNTGFIVVPVDHTIAQAMRQIEREIVPEMPDRIIAATALHLGIPLVSCDRKIQNLQIIQCIW